jgi:predicted transcriptional regulator
MSRINLTLDADTEQRLARHAKRLGKPRAAAARQLLSDGLARREAQERRKTLAADYSAGRHDAREILEDLERAQLDLLDEE